MVKLTDRLWINPAHVALVAAAAEGGGSVVGLVNGANLAIPDPPHVVAFRLAGAAGTREPAGIARPPLRVVPGSERDE